MTDLRPVIEGLPAGSAFALRFKDQPKLGWVNYIKQHSGDLTHGWGTYDLLNEDSFWEDVVGYELLEALDD